MSSLIAARPSVKPAEKFFRLTVDGVPFYIRMDNGFRYQYVVCRCECGNYCIASCADLRRNHTRSCNCLKGDKLTSKNFVHGFAKYGNRGRRHSLYEIWAGMIKRCTNPKCNSFEDYGGRGIEVCDGWRNDYKAFHEWSLVHGWKEGLTIDRRDNESGYSPENCRFVTMAVNSRNKRTTRNITAFGETKCASEWIRDSRCVMGLDGLLKRLRSGMTPEEAISAPHKK